jgi:hypothetical protein
MLLLDGAATLAREVGDLKAIGAVNHIDGRPLYCYLLGRSKPDMGHLIIV